jgi:hypothetical protein
MIPFYLRDDTGVIRVDPRGAEIEPVVFFEETCGRGDPLYYGKGPAGAVTDSDHRRRFVERGLPVGTALYIAGQSRERQDVVAAEIAADDRAPLFLISTRSEKQVESGMGWASWGLAVLALGLAAAGIFIGRHDSRDLPIPELIVGGAAFLVAWALGWCWMAYNSLITLRQRVRNAAALIDIELKRRHDLIPAIVAAVQGYRDYESTLQKEIAALRTQMQATLPGRPGPGDRRTVSRPEGERVLHGAGAVADGDGAAHRARPLLLQFDRDGIQHLPRGGARPLHRGAGRPAAPAFVCRRRLRTRRRGRRSLDTPMTNPNATGGRLFCGSQILKPGYRGLLPGVEYP